MTINKETITGRTGVLNKTHILEKNGKNRDRYVGDRPVYVNGKKYEKHLLSPNYQF